MIKTITHQIWAKDYVPYRVEKNHFKHNLTDNSHVQIIFALRHMPFLVPSCVPLFTRFYLEISHKCSQEPKDWLIRFFDAVPEKAPIFCIFYNFVITTLQRLFDLLKVHIKDI